MEYKHTPKVWANGHSGWETICLPFEATEYEASKSGEIVPIMLGGSGNFWLRRFAGASRNNVYFSSTLDGVMEAYTPYLVAFPGESMGDGHLQGETITFRGYGADITTMKSPELTKDNYTFVGNFDKKKDEATGWALDNAGGSFVLNENLGDVPFQSYFRAKAKANKVSDVNQDNKTDMADLRLLVDIVLGRQKPQTITEYPGFTDNDQQGPGQQGGKDVYTDDGQRDPGMSGGGGFRDDDMKDPLR